MVSMANLQTLAMGAMGETDQMVVLVKMARMEAADILSQSQAMEKTALLVLLEAAEVEIKILDLQALQGLLVHLELEMCKCNPSLAQPVEALACSDSVLHIVLYCSGSL